MKEKETFAYVPLEIEVVEVQIEKGYAVSDTTGNGLNGMPNDEGPW